MLRRKLKISRELTVGPHLDEDGLQELAKKGYKTIVNLCKKGELDQPLSPKEEAVKTEELGMEYVHVPISIKDLKSQHIDALCKELSETEKPVYLHCRIGQRSSTVGLIYHAIRKDLSVRRTLTKARKLGLSWNAPILQAFIEKYIERTRPMREEVLVNP